MHLTAGFLGIGFPYLRNAPSELYRADGLIDFVEIAPDTLCHQNEEGRLEFDAELLDVAIDATASRPVVVHGVELSIGSACGWYAPYIEALDEFRKRRSFLWHSEHLGYLRYAARDGQIRSTGVPLPLPFTRAAADLVVRRARRLQSRYGVPFLLENAVHYLPDLPNDPGWDEGRFLAEVSERANCGLLLDLFNVHCNAVNFGVSPHTILEHVPYDRVLEIHVAGGASHEAFLLDSHSDVIPAAVWELLHEVAPRCPQLGGIVFEVLDEALAGVGLEAVVAQLEELQRVAPTRRRQMAVAS